MPATKSGGRNRFRSDFIDNGTEDIVTKVPSDSHMINKVPGINRGMEKSTAVPPCKSMPDLEPTKPPATASYFNTHIVYVSDQCKMTMVGMIFILALMYLNKDPDLKYALVAMFILGVLACRLFRK